MSKTKAKVDDKPKRLYFKSYLQLIHNSLGSKMFRNFYIEAKDKSEHDALQGGVFACAFYVSSVLVVFKKLGGVHATVDSTLNDLKASGWKEVKTPKAGDVLIWEPIEFDDGPNQHIGFSVGDGRAVSTSYTEFTPVEHSQDFDGKRKIEHIYRMSHWE